MTLIYTYPKNVYRKSPFSIRVVMYMYRDLRFYIHELFTAQVWVKALGGECLGQYRVSGCKS